MTKRETKLSKQFIDRLRMELQAKGQRILLSKIHGHEYQERMVDYLGCYKGTFIAIEFKVDDNELTDYQADYLLRASLNQGMGMVIRFIGNQMSVTCYTREMSLSKEYVYNESPLFIFKQAFAHLSPD